MCIVSINDFTSLLGLNKVAFSPFLRVLMVQLYFRSLSLLEGIKELLML